MLTIDDPFNLFGEWMAEAEKSEVNDPNAMTLATANAQGHPSARMVLLKKWDSNGFVFYTNLESHKGRNLAENPYAALLFHWKTLRRQIRIEGTVTPVSKTESDDYFASRPRSSQIGAWASQQSRPLSGRFELERSIAEHTVRFGLQTIPRPDYWSGFCLVPSQIEFWHDRPFRLHERVLCQWDGKEWSQQTLYP